MASVDSSGVSKPEGPGEWVTVAGQRQTERKARQLCAEVQEVVLVGTGTMRKHDEPRKARGTLAMANAGRWLGGVDWKERRRMLNHPQYSRVSLSIHTRVASQSRSPQRTYRSRGVDKYMLEREAHSHPEHARRTTRLAVFTERDARLRGKPGSVSSVCCVRGARIERRQRSRDDDPLYVSRVCRDRIRTGLAARPGTIQFFGTRHEAPRA